MTSHARAQRSPDFQTTENKSTERFIALDDLGEALQEGFESGLGHGWDELEEHGSLREQGVGSGFAGVGFELALHAEAFAGGTEEG